MLRVQLNQVLTTIRDSWVEEKPGIRELPTSHSHLTVLFVGRDLDEKVGTAMREVGKKVALPSTIRVEVGFRMMGYREDHMVAMVTPLPDLQDLRLDLIHHMDIAISGDIDTEIASREGSWGFNPHITLAKTAIRDTPPPPMMKPCILPVEALIVKVGSEI